MRTLYSEEISPDDKLPQASETGQYWISSKCPVRQICPKNEPDNIVLPKTVSKAMEIRSTLLNNGEIIGQLKNMADILREEMMQHRNWSFKWSFEDFENPHYSSSSSPISSSAVMLL